jgi:hypothetical protein
LLVDSSNHAYPIHPILAPQLCRAEYAFERRPLRALAGIAREVLIADDLSHCLALCLEAVGIFVLEF